MYFTHLHVQDTIVILEEGNRSYPRCPQCDIFVPKNSLNVRHLATTFCRRGMERRWCCLEKEDAREGTERLLTAYGPTLSQVTSFKCLARLRFLTTAIPLSFYDTRTRPRYLKEVTWERGGP